MKYKVTLLGVIALISVANPVMAHTVTAPEVMIANPDGSVDFEAIFRAGPNGADVSSWSLSFRQRNGDGTISTAHFFCRENPGEPNEELLIQERFELPDISKPAVIEGRVEATCQQDPEQTTLEFRTVVLPPICGESTALCLQDGKFVVEVAFEDQHAEPARGYVVHGASNKSGNFLFFEQENWEVLVKVLDGCKINDRYWAFLSTATNVMYTVTVTQTDTGITRQYGNQRGETPLAITDTSTFEGCPGG
jgi:hypothetical protein